MKVPGALIPNFGKPFSTLVFYDQNFFNKESFTKIVTRNIKTKKILVRILVFVNILFL